MKIGPFHYKKAEADSCLLVLSGGQDSTTCGYWAKAVGFKTIHAVTFDYGQRHAIELEAAKRIADRLQCASHEIVTLGPILKGTSPLVSDAALEQYEDHQSLPGGLEKTFVPMRNQLFLTLAANRAYVLGIRDVVTGVCQEDSGGYPDCRSEFICDMENACNSGTFTGADGALGPLTIHTPLMHMTKAESVEMAFNIPGCFSALALTHTSYDGAYPPTGKDHATLLRAKGFWEAGYPDPLVVRAWAEGLMDLPPTDNYVSYAAKRLIPALM